jgi:hypothetical protein
MAFPHAAQALRITRRTRLLGSRRWRTVTVYAITNLTAYQASPAHLADYLRGHWHIEALRHSARDVGSWAPVRVARRRDHRGGSPLDRGAPSRGSFAAPC